MEIGNHKWLLIVVLTVLSLSVQAQDLFYRKNLANIKVDNLSQDQVLRFQQQVQTSSMSEQEIANYLRAKGLSREEIEKLKKRMGGLSGSGSGSVVGNFEVMDQYFKLRDSLQRIADDSLSGSNYKSRAYVRAKLIPDSIIFGSELFANAKMSFMSDGQMATPANYIIGPGDIINLTLYGAQEVNTDIKVLPDGTVNIPYAGVLPVVGATIESATARIKRALQQNGYSTLATGETKLSINIAEFRSFKVTVIGAKSPGNYRIPSVATVFHVLHLSGGPGQKGTYRDIEVIRKGKVIRKIDLYKFMVSGSLEDDINLQENDVINIPSYENRVMLKGEVKRPGLFEIRDGENMDSLLRYAGGFTPIAYKGRIYVEQIGLNEFVTRDVEKAGFTSYFPGSGDVIIVGSIVNRYIERIVIEGAISRPGYYGWEEGMELSTLIKRAGGLKENALLTRGLIYRANRDHSKAYERFIPQEIVDGRVDLVLADGDSVVIGDKSVLYPDETIRVVGEVKTQGSLVYGEGMTAMDAILLSGGMLKNAQFNRIEIARRVEGTGDMEIAKVLQATSNAELMVLADEIILQEMDVVMVRPNPAYFEQRVVILEGEVTYPGPYVLLKRRERLSDLIGRSGGLTSLADANAAFIIRETKNPFFMKVKRKMEAGEMNDDKDKDGSSMIELDQDSMIQDTIAIDIKAVMGKKGSKYDINLIQGDIVYIPTQKNTITVRGEVNNTVIVNYSGKKLKPYLRDAGGTSRFADKKRVYVVDPSGRASATKQFMGIRTYPKVVPGSIVMVPPKVKKDDSGADPAKVAAVSSILASTSGLLFVILTLVR